MLSTAGSAIKVIGVLMVLFQWFPAEASTLGVRLESLTNRIPQRSIKALTGSQFVNLIAKIDENQRERSIGEQLLKGNLPGFLKKLKPVKLQHRNKNGKMAHATIFVTPDYLAIGSQADFIRIPMNRHTASMVAARFGFILPTRRIVDAIYNQSEDHFIPQPLPPGPQMRSTGYYQLHNRKIRQQRLSHSIALGELVSGDKKDVVITNKLINKPGRIAIYGWHRPDGHPIQPLSTVHGAGYADYSHGIRLVSDKVLVDGELRSIHDILKDPELSYLLSDEGPIMKSSYNPGLPVLPKSKMSMASSR